MYISKIKLENIRCFEELIIELMLEDGIKMWLTILGDNSVGKSTILKSLAMGLVDISSAAALMKEDKANFIRKGKTKGVITISIYDEIKKEKYQIVTNISI